MAVFAMVCACSASANELTFNPLVVVPSNVGSPPHLHSGLGQLRGSFFEIFFNVSVGVPASSFFDITYDLALRRVPLPPLAPQEQIPIEMVQLELRSAQPITVTSGGTTTSDWVIRGWQMPNQGVTSGTSMGPNPPGQGGGELFLVDSFFDVFFQIELNPFGGSTQTIPSSGPMDLAPCVPDQASTVALGVVSLLLLATSRRCFAERSGLPRRIP
jgi:hypothetical protein